MTVRTHILCHEMECVHKQSQAVFDRKGFLSPGAEGHLRTYCSGYGQS